MKKLQTLLELAKTGANTKPQRISSTKLAKKIGCSQQTASRWLNQLSEKNLIKQNTDPKGQTIKITPKGINWLESLHTEFHKAFGKSSQKFLLTGKITSGFGEGKYYINQMNYKNQFKNKLGFEPFPGTLDIELNEKSLPIKKELQKMTGKKIEGFSNGERTFGDVKCFPAKIKEEKAALVLPSRTHHEEKIIEVISPEKIREKHGLEDGDEVKLEVQI